MKDLFILLAIISISQGSSFIGQVGQKCNSDDSFLISSFGISPYPPGPGIQMTINMPGAFSRETYIADISIRTNYNRGGWVYKYIDIDQKFYYGQLYTFSLPILAGTLNGPYQVQIFLEKVSEKASSAAACWEFTYQIS